jgi:hypothetical protein
MATSARASRVASLHARERFREGSFGKGRMESAMSNVRLRNGRRYGCSQLLGSQNIVCRSSCLEPA